MTALMGSTLLMLAGKNTCSTAQSSYSAETTRDRSSASAGKQEGAPQQACGNLQRPILAQLIHAGWLQDPHPSPSTAGASVQPEGSAHSGNRRICSLLGDGEAGMAVSSIGCVCCWVFVLRGFDVLLIAAVPSEWNCFWVSARSCSLQAGFGNRWGLCVSQGEGGDCTFAALWAEQWQFWPHKPKIRTKASPPPFSL